MTMKNESFSYKGYTGSAEFSHEDRCLVGQILYIDDLILYEGDSYDELEKAFQSSVDEYLKFCNEAGKEPQKAYSGSFNIRIGADLHAKAARKAIQSGISLNEFVRQAVEQKTGDPAVREAIARNSLDALDLIVPVETHSSSATAAGSSIAAFLSLLKLDGLEHQRHVLQTVPQIEGSSDSATTNVVAAPGKKPVLRKIA